MLDNLSPNEALTMLLVIIIVGVTVANGLSLWLFKGTMNQEDLDPPTERR